MVGNALGDGSAYWTSWQMDLLGNRKQQVDHSLTGGTDTTTNYTYDGVGSNQPHTLTSTATTGGATASTSYTYDVAGNTVTRNAGKGNQTLAWDDAGKLTGITGGTAGNSSYIYTGDGDLLLQKDPGQTVLYLPGQQLTLDTKFNTLSGTRYYALPGGGTCIRTGSGSSYTFALPDPQGTPSLYLDNTAQTPTWRQYTPYGAPRGASALYPDNRGFLNKPTSPDTGLTMVGARAYDPTIGRFVSVDPVQDLADPQQWNGYAYANNSPITRSDPSGLKSCSDDACAAGADWEDDHGNYHDNPGNNDGCNGCSNTSGPKKPPTINDINATPVPGDIPWGYLRSNGYNKKTFTYGDAREFAKKNADTAMYVCEHVFGGSNAQCGDTTAWMSNKEGAILLLLFFVSLFIPVRAGARGRGRAVGETGVEIDPYNDPLHSSSTYPAEGTTALREVEESLGGVGCKSFSATTNVLMADGSHKPISELKPGDKVLATDPGIDATSSREVANVWKHPDQLVSISVGNDVIATTEDHPYWNATDHQWQRADELDPGDLLLTPNGVAARFNGLLIGPARTAPAYNLTVADIHTYYVMAGNTPVLVHNDGDGWIYVTGPNGERLPVAQISQVPGSPLKWGYGREYDVPEGTPGLNKRVKTVRVMLPSQSNPDGYVVYRNAGGQTVNPVTGQTTRGKFDPYAHISADTLSTSPPC